MKHEAQHVYGSGGRSLMVEPWNGLDENSASPGTIEFEEENSLPRPQDQLVLFYWDDNAISKQSRPQVGMGIAI